MIVQMTVSDELLNKAYPIIDKLAKSRSANGAFAYYEKTDVYQEIWALCLEAMDRYNPDIGPIENYLVRHVTNRMKNLKRDKYFRPGCDVSTSGLAKTRMNLVNALSLGICETANQGTLLGSSVVNVDPVEHMLCWETLFYIRERLPQDLIGPFDALVENNKVRSAVVSDIRHNIAEILAERDEDAKT